MLVPGAGGGPQPGAGRPPDEFKRRMRALLDRDSIERFLGECLNGDHGEAAFFKAVEFTADRGEGKVPNVTKLTGDEAAPLTIRVVRE